MTNYLVYGVSPTKPRNAIYSGLCFTTGSRRSRCANLFIETSPAGCSNSAVYFTIFYSRDLTRLLYINAHHLNHACISIPHSHHPMHKSNAFCHSGLTFFDNHSGLLDKEAGILRADLALASLQVLACNCLATQSKPESISGRQKISALPRIFPLVHACDRNAFFTVVKNAKI